MGRPKKSFDELRIYQVNLRLTETENEFAIQQAEISGCTSVANWLRKSAFSKRPLKPQKITPMHRAYYQQLVGLSSNVNQIARKINSGEYTKIFYEIQEVRKLLVDINNLFISNDSQTD